MDPPGGVDLQIKHTLHLVTSASLHFVVIYSTVQPPEEQLI
jgi:hypothetical protein